MAKGVRRFCAFDLVIGSGHAALPPGWQQRVIEISRRLKLPKAGFICAAKQAGIKFTLGTNHTDANLGRDEYGLAMIRECKLA